ncbi:MAG: hypothetical protein U5N86_03710 [Planctomycetota bacterium]|nr:hypothetical protein [Planctomycetota bacterium]
MKNRTRTSCGIIAVVLIIVFASVYYFVGDGIRVFVSDSPLEPEKPEVPIVQHIPSNASAAWRADDFKSLITSLAPSALGKILLSNDVNLYLFSLLNPDKPKELRDSTLYMAYSIRQLAITVLEGEPILILKLDDEGETHLRKLKELVYESNSLFETQEDGLTWVKRESAQVPRKLFCYRTAGNLLVLGASEEGVRAIYDEPGEEHYRDAFTEADDETIRHIVGSSRIGEGMAYFFNTVGKWGSRWEIRFSEELASDLEVEAISGDMVSHEDATMEWQRERYRLRRASCRWRVLTSNRLRVLRVTQCGKSWEEKSAREQYITSGTRTACRTTSF